MLLLSVFLRSIKQTLRSPGRLSIIVGFPIGFILVFAFIFGGGEIGETTKIKIGVVNNDASGPLVSQWRDYFSNYTKPWSDNETTDPLTLGFGTFFIASLEGKTGLVLSNKSFRIITFESESKARLAVQSRAVTLAAIIPDDFSFSILSGINAREVIVNKSIVLDDQLIVNKNATLNLLGDPSYQSFQDAMTELESALNNLESEFYGIDLPAGNFESDFQSVVSYELTQFDYFISGFFTFGLILASSSVAGILGEEREYRTLDRLKISEMRPIELLGGISLYQVATGAVQLSLMFVTAYILGFRGIGDPFSAFIVGMLTILPILGIAFFVSAYVPNGRDANGVIAILSAPIGFLSGSFLEVPSIPLIPDLIPTGTGSLRALELWDFFPFSASVTAIRNILLFNYSLDQVLSELIFLLIGGIIFFVFGLVFFVWRVFKPEK